MKSNKEIVLELLRQCTGMAAGEESEGVSTQYLSKRLDMQRTNISAILNALVKEGMVEKRGGRPVLYRIARSQSRTAGDLIISYCNSSINLQSPSLNRKSSSSVRFAGPFMWCFPLPMRAFLARWRSISSRSIFSFVYRLPLWWRPQAPLPSAMAATP